MRRMTQPHFLYNYMYKNELLPLSLCRREENWFCGLAKELFHAVESL